MSTHKSFPSIITLINVLKLKDNIAISMKSKEPFFIVKDIHTVMFMSNEMRTFYTLKP